MSQNGSCKKCGEEFNMYGGCRCNGYTTALNAVKNMHIQRDIKDVLLNARQHWIDYLEDPNSVDLEQGATATIAAINVALNSVDKNGHIAQQAKWQMSDICPFYKTHDMVHVGDGAGIPECTCNGRPGSTNSSGR